MTATIARIFSFIPAMARSIFLSPSRKASSLGSFLKIWEAIKALCVALWNALSTAAKSIFKALKAFWDTWGSTIISVFGRLRYQPYRTGTR